LHLNGEAPLTKATGGELRLAFGCRAHNILFTLSSDMMQIQTLFPKAAAVSPADRIQEIMRGFLYRSNFVPGVRHIIGWRGLKDCSGRTTAWTARIRKYAGVFALYFQSAEVRKGWLNGHFGLAYFPEPDEALIEKVPIAGLVYARQDNYLAHIRDFLSHPRLMDLFTIGRLNLTVGFNESTLLLGLESMDRQRAAQRLRCLCLENRRGVAPGFFRGEVVAILSDL
jgi:hypothetical protein